MSHDRFLFQTHFYETFNLYPGWHNTIILCVCTYAIAHACTKVSKAGSNIIFYLKKTLLVRILLYYNIVL